MITVLDRDGVYINSYTSLFKACEDNGISYSYIRKKKWNKGEKDKRRTIRNFIIVKK